MTHMVARKARRHRPNVSSDGQDPIELLPMDLYGRRGRGGQYVFDWAIWDAEGEPIERGRALLPFLEDLLDRGRPVTRADVRAALKQHWNPVGDTPFSYVRAVHLDIWNEDAGGPGPLLLRAADTSRGYPIAAV